MATFVLVALVVYVFDHIMKYWAELSLTIGQAQAALDGVLEWRLSHNDGMALGLLGGQTALVIALPIVAVTIGALVFRYYRMTAYTRVSAALVFGGFAGNFADRLIDGYVVDMLYFPWMPWYVCNVADVAICVGVALLVVSLLFRPKDWIPRKQKKEIPDGNAEGGA